MQNYAAVITPAGTLVQPAVTPSPALEPRAWDSTLTFALTTVLARPSTCDDAVLTFSNNMTQTGKTNSGTISVVRNGGPGCYPSYFFAGEFKAIYSPGVCPSGMYIANSVVSVDASATVTEARCCASGATVETAGALCSRSALESVTYVVGGTSSVILGNYRLMEPAVTVQWAASNLNQFDPHSAPVLALNQPATTTASSTIDTRSPTQASTVQTTQVETHNGGLETGIKVGIGVGAAVGAVLILGLLFWALYQRRKLGRQLRLRQQNPSTAQRSSALPMSYESFHDHGLHAAKYEEQPIEMSSEKDAMEMGGSRTPRVKGQSWGKDLARYRSELQG